eukprot:TRINITY_DN7505_c0_g1_i1.p1 TRINITY_DN7505_c0_g1~~TRINITY_DN7505_c0_g1_i1.p1  ORF type:complete len:484 (+),score=61.07 TRINITY_DN7505_c0_g1_i1:64-1515(+)
MYGKRRPVKPTTFQFVKCDQNPCDVLPSGAPQDFTSLSKVLQKLEQNEKQVSYLGLEAAIKTFEAYMSRLTQQHWSFYSELLPSLLEWATQYSLARHVVLLEQGCDSSNTLTAQECRFLLANAFFLNLHNLRMTFLMQKRTIGSLDFGIIYRENNTLAVGKILCMLSYFTQVKTLSDPERLITFARHVISEPPDWKSNQTVIDCSIINVHSKEMEASRGRGFVDFANKDLQMGTILASMTQEEVLFCCCPECFVGLLFTEQFRSDEVMTISGVRRFSAYSGYQLTFEWKGFYEKAQRLHDVIVMDANHKGQQFTQRLIQRDLNKAWCSFNACPSASISTGHWGCGVFGGDKTLKLLQQLCAATVASVQLDYSTFKDHECKEKFVNLMMEIDDAKITVSKLYQIMEEYEEQREKHTNTGANMSDRDESYDGNDSEDLRWDFYDFVLCKLRSRHNPIWNSMLYIGGGSLLALATGMAIVRRYKIK